ncbi:hypothetical protein U9M48_006558 [Paspalum notatum var. saurae]|uniref:TF-B3 domain-containing protein n=1 Tax=Paspalum notatum var. saurae TaxID=547442 RepID=A0AAQ3PPB4_PASNO
MNVIILLESYAKTEVCLCSAAMEEEMADLSLGDFQFFKILLPGMYEEALRLPAKFVRQLGGRRDLKLRLAGEGVPLPLWDVEVFAGEKHGDMYLGRGWNKFVSAHDLRDGYILVFRYDGGQGELAVTVFDLSTCQKQYVHAGAAAGTYDGDGRRSLAIPEPSHFAVTLRPCNFGEKQNQYLNVPLEFQVAHGYERRRQVELRMDGGSWKVNLKRSKRPLGGMRTALKYGWNDFCVDNGLEVGDTCFFRVIREGGCDDEEDEWEQVDEGDQHVLKVEVRKTNGTVGIVDMKDTIFQDNQMLGK